MYKVAVLISTYNGQRYLKEQLESIVNQTYKDIDVYIRDDASTDGTEKILKEYEKYEYFHIFYSKKNLGYPKCFYTLTDMSIEADIFMFADQDDVWLPNKIEMAVETMKKEANDIPVAYFANYYICDSKLNIIGKPFRRKTNIEFSDVLFDVGGLEFTMAINVVAKDMLNKLKPLKVKARGTWMSLLFAAFGKIIYDPRFCAYYRRHDAAVTASNMNWIGMWRWRIKQFLVDNGFKEYKSILKEFYVVTKEKLKLKDRRVIEIFLNEKYFPGVLKKIFYPHRLREKLLDDIGLRIAFLFNFL